MKKLLSIGWFAVGVTILGSTFAEIVFGGWQLSWLAIGVVASASAMACFAVLYFELRGKLFIAHVVSGLFLAYWVYLFLISPPDQFNRYSLTGGAIILLCVVTVGKLVMDRRNSAGTT